MAAGKADQQTTAAEWDSGRLQGRGAIAACVWSGGCRRQQGQRVSIQRNGWKQRRQRRRTRRSEAI